MHGAKSIRKNTSTVLAVLERAEAAWKEGGPRAEVAMRENWS